jgi:lipopolysaccharide biosynthesis glycosyltransferase
MDNVIVTCVTANWIAPAAVTLLSCAKYGAESFARLIIVTPNPSATDVEELEAFKTKHNVKIELIEVESGEFDKFETGRFSVGTLLRLKLDEFLPRNLNRVLYLDSDILACCSCDELFSLDLRNHAFAAAEDIAHLPWMSGGSKSPNGVRHFNKIGFPVGRPYFNAGVILFDWQRTLDSATLSKALALLNGEVVTLILIKMSSIWSVKIDGISFIPNGTWIKKSQAI